MQKLDAELFKTVVRATPLVSIDLIVKNGSGKVLLGRRKNRPARDFWFVPGGRILKDETIESALERLIDEELESAVASFSVKFRGVFEHFYDDNFFGDGFTTHYVVLAYELLTDQVLDDLPTREHRNYRWFISEDVIQEPYVHQLTKDYFLMGNKPGPTFAV